MRAALEFINYAGINVLTAGIETGVLNSRAVLWTLGRAIDSYVESQVPTSSSLTELRGRIVELPAKGALIVGGNVSAIANLLSKNDKEVMRVVRGACSPYSRKHETRSYTGEGDPAPFDLKSGCVWIPYGEFQMGSNITDKFGDFVGKAPAMVMAGGFFMLERLVSNAEFAEFLSATGRKDERSNYMRKLDGDNSPAVCVTHDEAEDYSQWWGQQVSKQTGHQVIGRLPTEVEWEKAARGPWGLDFMYPPNEKQAYYAVHPSDELKMDQITRAVDHPEAYSNGYGLKDMIGNVNELTSTTFEAGGRVYVMVRGGSWRDAMICHLLAISRRETTTTSRSQDVGFRPILVPQTPDA